MNKQDLQAILNRLDCWSDWGLGLGKDALTPEAEREAEKLVEDAYALYDTVIVQKDRIRDLERVLSPYIINAMSGGKDETV